MFSTGHAFAQIVDRLNFADPASEKSHRVVVENGETVPGALGLHVPRLLPANPPQIYGGHMEFAMKVDPTARNYFTIKLWADDETGAEASRLYLYVTHEGRDYQVGYRHQGDYQPLAISGSRSPLPGRFYYSTTMLPRWMTEGKTELTLKIQSAGRLYGHGKNDEDHGGNYQFNQKLPSRGIYSVYTHTNPLLDVPADEPQGRAPEVVRRPSPGPEILDADGAFTRGVNETVSNVLRRDRLDCNQIEMLATAYVTPEVSAAYHRPEVVEKVAAALDDIARAYYTDNSDADEWGGRYGPAGWAIHLLRDELRKSWDKRIDYGKNAGMKTRREAWSEMLFASRETGRLRNLRTLTNQTIYASTSVYQANRGLAALGDSRAFDEKHAQRYLAAAIGLEPWLGNDTPEGGHELLYGANYLQTTRKGQTREWGFAGSGYGEMQHMAARFYRMTGNPAFRDQAVKIAYGRAPFRRPSIEIDPQTNHAYQTMEGLGWIAWRGGGEFLDKILYASPGQWAQGIYAAAATMDPTLIGYAKQMIDDDNQFFSQLVADSRGYRNGTGVSSTTFDVWADYRAIKKAADSGARLPMTSGRPDFVWADEENQIIALKRGENRLWLTTYFQAKKGTGVNRLGAFHYSTPRYDQIGVLETRVDYPVGDASPVRAADMIDLPERTIYSPPNPPLQAYGGEPAPLAKWPDDARECDPFIGRTNFSATRFGPWFIAFNSTTDRSFPLDPPADFAGAKDLVTGQTKPGPLSVGPLQTIVLETSR